MAAKLHLNPWEFIHLIQVEELRVRAETAMLDVGEQVQRKRARYTAIDRKISTLKNRLAAGLISVEEFLNSAAQNLCTTHKP